MAHRIDKDWFTSILAERDLSQRQLARLMGCDPASIHRLLTGKRPMRMDEVTAISNLLAVPVSDVLEHAGMSVTGTGRTVPMVGIVDGQGEAHLDWNARGPAVVAPVDLPVMAVAVQMHTAASPLEPMDGWTLFAKIPQGVATDILGRLCLVGLQDHGLALLRFVRRGYKAGTFNLMYPGLGDLPDTALDWATAILHILP